MRNLIEESTFEVTLTHQNRVRPFQASVGLPSRNGLEFDYIDRYELKNKDSGKCRFCPSALLSKQYQNSLKQLGLQIYPHIESFFLYCGGPGESKTPQWHPSLDIDCKALISLFIQFEFMNKSTIYKPKQKHTASLSGFTRLLNSYECPRN